MSQETALSGAMKDRLLLASYLGMQYGIDRDIYEALGYPTTITFAEYAAKYERQDIASAIIDRPAEASWGVGFQLFENEEEDKTEFETAWDSFYNNKALKINETFLRVDKLTQIGEYGCLFLGFNDVTNIADLKTEVKKGQGLQLQYIKPYSQGSITITEYDNDLSSVRYKKPLLYTINNSKDAANTQSLVIHHSRIIHITDVLLESEILGVPRLQKVYNRLMDLEKLTGGSAEMFWRGARPGFQAKVDDDYELTPTEEANLKEQIDEYENNLRRILTAQGIDMKALQTQVSDPKNHIDIQIQMISAATGIPKRILTGTERGELSSSEDRTTWNELIKYRQHNFLEPKIINQFVGRLQDLGLLPKAEIKIKWPDLYSPSDKEKAEVGKIRATALKEYTANPNAQMILPSKLFFKYAFGLSDKEIEKVMESVEAYIKEQIQIEQQNIEEEIETE